MVQCELANFQYGVAWVLFLGTCSIGILIARISTVTLENVKSILVINMSRTTKQDDLSGGPASKSVRCTLHITWVATTFLD
jgi:hypothetical protein